MDEKVVEAFALTDDSWSDLMEGVEGRLSYEILEHHGDEWLRYAFEKVDPGRRDPEQADEQPLLCERLVCVAGLHLLLNRFMGCVVESDLDGIEPDWAFRNSNHLEPALVGLLCGQTLSMDDFLDECSGYDPDFAIAAFDAIVKYEASSLGRQLEKALGEYGLLVSMLVASGITSDGSDCSSVDDSDEETEDAQAEAIECELATPLFPVTEDVFASVVDGAYMSMSELVRINECFNEI